MLIRSIEFAVPVVIVMLVLSVSSRPSTNHDTESWTLKLQVRVTVDPRTIEEEGEDTSELIIGAEEEERLVHSSYQFCSVCFVLLSFLPGPGLVAARVAQVHVREGETVSDNRQH